MRKIHNRFLGGLLILVMMASLCGCNKPAADNTGLGTKNAQAAVFANYKEVPVEENPQVEPYTVASDLSNVSNADRFEFSSASQDLLVKNGFAVLPAQNAEFFAVYENNRYDFIPSFVTTDSMLHNYHLYFSHLLKSIESTKLIPELKKLNQGMLSDSLEQYEALQGTEWENAARRNLAFFTVGSILLDDSIKPDEAVQSEVAQELALIKGQAGIEISPVMGMGQPKDILESLKEDYTQYIPRGYYTQTEELTRYFQSMMWYGRLTFRVKNADETRSAVLMTLALSNEKNLQPWNNIYAVSEFMVGKSDDLGYRDYIALLQDIYGEKFSYDLLTKDEERWNTFTDKLSKLKAPEINSIPIFDAEIQPDRNAEIMGYRFMGQRYTLDADIFQRLIYREVEENSQGQRRLLPKGLDIPAAFGSTAASEILKDLGEYDYENYPENMLKMQNFTAGLALSSWTQNLYWNWLYTLKPLTQEKPQGYPTFMLNQAWQKKELNTFLASWTELKHDTILYAKQVIAEAGGGGDEEIDDRGYVEPNPYVYARLAALTAMTREGLETRELISSQDIDNLQKLEELALGLKTISEKELQGILLTDEEFELIRSYGVQLEHFWLEALRDNGVVSPSQAYNNPAALVTDVATDPSGFVLQEGTGYINQIYAIVPVDGTLRIARGGVYSYYEFTGKTTERLTDEKWQELLMTDKIPAAPDWTKAYTGSGEVQIKMPWENE
ncbi:MAG TPA: DUF3160 domain-containing protein [Syntrophomonadaceae bacterium]|mgnify:CR=1 FL=1|nr:DUF3160 domain-containing protein [Syntrophomonadaceae bacterium]HPR94223.1 DUF3160 domain-containing protein [Syntrophomonadaceae bacterium]